MITIFTSRPYSLLKKINEYMDSYRIQTWEYDSQGDYTINSNQWRFLAWFRPLVTKGEKIDFIIVGNKEAVTTIHDYAVYHGKFAEMLISHFFPYFSRIEMTPVPTRYDLIRIVRDED